MIVVPGFMGEGGWRELQWTVEEYQLRRLRQCVLGTCSMPLY